MNNLVFVFAFLVVSLGILGWFAWFHGGLKEFFFRFKRRKQIDFVVGLLERDLSEEEFFKCLNDNGIFDNVLVKLANEKIKKRGGLENERRKKEFVGRGGEEGDGEGSEGCDDVEGRGGVSEGTYFDSERPSRYFN